MKENVAVTGAATTSSFKKIVYNVLSDVTYGPSHRQACAPVINIPGKLRTPPDLSITVSLQCYLVAPVIHVQSLRSQICVYIHKGKAVPLQAWSGPEGSRKLRFPDFMTTAQNGGRVVSLTHGRLHPQEMRLVLISVRDRVDPRAIVRSEGFYANEKIRMTPGGTETATLRFAAQHLNPLNAELNPMCHMLAL